MMLSSRRAHVEAAVLLHLGSTWHSDAIVVGGKLATDMGVYARIICRCGSAVHKHPETTRGGRWI
eukprot:m.59991 g.59991  ORF g.59991 m.59991 type:complete len:65 (+) comp13833_c0_seq1:502-696(+)